MTKLLLFTTELDKDYLLDANGLSTERVSEVNKLNDGNAIEIYLPQTKTKAIVALYVHDGCYYLLVGHKKFDLSGSNIRGELSGNWRKRRFTLSQNHHVLLSFDYVYGDVAHDLLQECVELLEDPLKDLLIEHAISFFTSQSENIRLSIDSHNSHELSIARKVFRKKFSWYKQLILLLKYGR